MYYALYASVCADKPPHVNQCPDDDLTHRTVNSPGPLPLDCPIRDLLGNEGDRECNYALLTGQRDLDKVLDLITPLKYSL